MEKYFPYLIVAASGLCKINLLKQYSEITSL